MNKYESEVGGVMGFVSLRSGGNVVRQAEDVAQAAEAAQTQSVTYKPRHHFERDDNPNVNRVREFMDKLRENPYRLIDVL